MRSVAGSAAGLHRRVMPQAVDAEIVLPVRPTTRLYFTIGGKAKSSKDYRAYDRECDNPLPEIGRW